MNHDLAQGLAGELRRGSVEHLNVAAGFGYMRDHEAGLFIFLVEKALTHAHFRKLRLGSEVRFRLEGGVRVISLWLD
ncbi:cold shock domain-containing protein [Azohydromonas sediminis]|uniref:cold shock domain-containing protein n=1 Tax=Azohydromonas sediminis TaxID=2259674 RepID=UPI0013C2CB9C|nr:cold shock domain-containing protein [Azohydromonas sediminis]